jgi:Bacterial Ig-like domain/FG-GAP-like repeat
MTANVQHNLRLISRASPLGVADVCGAWRTAALGHLRTALSCLGAAAVLCACGGGSGGATEPPVDNKPNLAARQFLPLQVGHRWVYRDSENSQPVVVRLTGTRTLAGATGFVRQSTDETDSETVYVEDAQGIREYPATNAEPLAFALGPVQVLRYPLRQGDSFVAADKDMGAVVDFDGDGVRDASSVRADTQVLGLETVDAPAGKLEGCLHLQTTAVLQVRLSRRNDELTKITAVTDDWFAPDIGLVRSETTTKSETGTTTSSRLLSGYGVGALRSEKVAPTAAAAALVGNPVLGLSTVLNITFSETMDPTTLATALQVKDANGRVVPGTIDLAPAGLKFTPKAAWADGSYSAQLSTAAQDLVGNALTAGQDWPFRIDALPPTLLQTQPLEGAVDVALAGSMVLRFNEPVDPTTVNERTVVAFYDGGVMTMLNYQVSGTVVTLTPKTALARGKRYSIVVQGVADLLGNAAQGPQVSFKTDPGRFGAFQLLPPAPGDDAAFGPVALGDVNGDGRVDAVRTSVRYDRGAPQATLLVHLQGADGRLAPPVAIALRAGCAAASIHVADVSGDGRSDVVVTEPSCGVEVFRQTAAGGLERDVGIDDPSCWISKLVDFNGDGRLDLVTFGSYEALVRVWTRSASAWVVQDSVSMGSDFRNFSMAVGDLNGDGRPDIAVTANSLPGFALVGVVMQGRTGRLESPQWLKGSNFENAFNLAIGDINDDGRADLVLGLSGGLATFKQGAAGDLGPLESISSDFFPSALTIADLNGDGKRDILSIEEGALSVRLQQPGGTFAPRARYPIDRFIGSPLPSDFVSSADLNGDGRPDVLIGDLLFLQRPVAVQAEALRPTAPVWRKGWAAQWLWHLQAAGVDMQRR